LSGCRTYVPRCSRSSSRTSPPPRLLSSRAHPHPTPTSPIDSCSPALLLPRGTAYPVPLPSCPEFLPPSPTHQPTVHSHPLVHNPPTGSSFPTLLATAVYPPPTQAFPSWEDAHRWIARTPGTLPCVNTTWIRSSTPGVDLPQEVIPDARDRQNVSRLDAHRARRGGSRSTRPKCDNVRATWWAVHVPGSSMARYL
jgi:hypothetical protein